MKLAASYGWSVVPSGSGNWLDAGNPLTRTEVIVSTARLNRILDHEPADLVASAEAGVTLSRSTKDSLKADSGCHLIRLMMEAQRSVEWLLQESAGRNATATDNRVLS